MVTSVLDWDPGPHASRFWLRFTHPKPLAFSFTEDERIFLTMNEASAPTHQKMPSLALDRGYGRVLELAL